MNYFRRFGAHLTLASLLTGLMATSAKDALKSKFPTWWVADLVGVGFVLFIIIGSILYGVHLVLLTCFAGDRYRTRLREQWVQRFSESLADAPIEGGQRDANRDNLDTATTLRVWIAKPSVVQEATKEIIRIERQRATKSIEIAEHGRRTAEDISRQLKAGLTAPALTKSLATHWTTVAPIELRAARTIDDPIHGCIYLDNKLATVLAHPSVQRLARVRQLSFSYSQFPSSTHSRLSHSLGVAKNAEVAISGLLDRAEFYVLNEAKPRKLPKSITENREVIVQKAKLVALLHDLGHGPFGHALDNYVGFIDPKAPSPKPDKLYTARYIKNSLASTLRLLGFDPAEIVAILDSEERWKLDGLNPVIGDVIDSSLDADRMDYLIRDAHMTGLTMGFTNTPAMLNYLRLVSDSPESAYYFLAYDEAALGYMEHFLYAREAMYYNCYEHARKKAAERIFQRLVKSLVEDTKIPIDDIYALTDEELLCLIRSSGTATDIQVKFCQELMSDLDYTSVYESAMIGDGVPKLLREWSDGAMKPLQKRMRYITEPEDWEIAIASASIGADRSWQVQVVIPPLRAAYEPHDNATQILRERTTGYAVEEFCSASEGIHTMIKEMNSQRNKLKVMCPAQLAATERKSIRKAAIQVFEQ